jgi:hypothetical protein
VTSRIYFKFPWRTVAYLCARPNRGNENEEDDEFQDDSWQDGAANQREQNPLVTGQNPAFASTKTTTAAAKQ